MEQTGFSGISRVIEESVPGKQVTIAHVIASPVREVYECLGIDELGAIGILTLSRLRLPLLQRISQQRQQMCRLAFWIVLQAL